MAESALPYRLTEEQRARVEIARNALATARNLNLVALSPADLVLAIEKLRSALHESLVVVDDLTE